MTYDPNYVHFRKVQGDERLCVIAVLTLDKMGWIVIDVCQFHCNGRGSRKPSKMATHIFSLEDHKVLILSFSV